MDDDMWIVLQVPGHCSNLAINDELLANRTIRNEDTGGPRFLSGPLLFGEVCGRDYG